VTDTLLVLVHAKYTTMRLPAVLALLKARLLMVPDLISFAFTCLKVAVAAPAGDGNRNKLRSPIVAATTIATARRVLGRRILERRMICTL
jgi:hypothetical protein